MKWNMVHTHLHYRLWWPALITIPLAASMPCLCTATQCMIFHVHAVKLTSAQRYLRSCAAALCCMAMGDTWARGRTAQGSKHSHGTKCTGCPQACLKPYPEFGVFRMWHQHHAHACKDVCKPTVINLTDHTEYDTWRTAHGPAALGRSNFSCRSLSTRHTHLSFSYISMVVWLAASS